jgi:hypothetical protein
MSSYAQAQNYSLTLVDPFEGTLSRVSKFPSLRRLRESVDRSTESSEYLTRFKEYEQAIEDLHSLASTRADWSSYESPAPSSESVEAAKKVLRLISGTLEMPTRILPSAEGGVAMIYISRTRNRAVIETLNNGEAYILLYDLDGNNDTLDLSGPPIEQVRHLGSLKNHLRS